MNEKPLLTSATITGGVAAVITLAVAFGLEVTAEQTAAILGVVGIAAPFVVWRAATNQVTANAKVVEKVTDGNLVVAGAANEIPTGEVIRTLGTPSEGSGDPGPGNHPGVLF